MTCPVIFDTIDNMPSKKLKDVEDCVNEHHGSLKIVSRHVNAKAAELGESEANLKVKRILKMLTKISQT